MLNSTLLLGDTENVESEEIVWYNTIIPWIVQFFNNIWDWMKGAWNSMEGAWHWVEKEWNWMMEAAWHWMVGAWHWMVGAWHSLEDSWYGYWWAYILIAICLIFCGLCFYFPCILGGILRCFLSCVGFGVIGVRACSCASCYQSCCYAATIPAKGCFACCQSIAMKG